MKKNKPREFTPQEQETYVNEAMNLLEDVGYYVQNLWHISDIAEKHIGLSQDEALGILNEALTSDRIMEEINIEIDNLIESIHEVPDEIVRMKMQNADKKSIQKKQQENGRQ